MASSSFRDSMNSLGWSRREQSAATTTTTTTTTKPSGVYGTLQKLNPFNSEGYVRLPVHENEGEGPGAPLPARSRREEEEGFFARKFYYTLFVLCSLRVGWGRCGVVVCLVEGENANVIDMDEQWMSVRIHTCNQQHAP